MKNKICLILFVGFFIFAAMIGNFASASAETVVNGGFETGDFTGWTTGFVDGSTAYPAFVWAASANNPTHSGSYDVWINDWNYVEQSFSPPVTPTSSGLSWWNRGDTLGNAGYTTVTIYYSDGTQKSVNAPDTSGVWHWWYTNLDQTKQVAKIRFVPSNHIDTFGVTIDDVSLVSNSAQPVSTSTGSGTAYFSSNAGIITNLQAVAENTLPTSGKPTNVAFPDGFFSFSITGLTSGQSVTLTLTLPNSVPVGSHYWKYQNGNWFSLPIGSDDGDNVITISLTDGGSGDSDGLANGVIVDPGGIANQKPTGSITINSGASYTTSRAITLSLSASTGVVKMRFSEDYGNTWGAWTNYANSYSYTLTSIGDGYKWVDVQFQDGAGVTSTAGTIYDGITLDTTPPTGTLLINNGSTYATSRTVTLNLTATDNLSGVHLMRFSENMGTWGSWVPFAITYTYTLTSANDGSKSVDVQYQDNAGQNSTLWAIYDYIILDTTLPTGTMLINNGSIATSSTSVYLNLTWTDGSGSGVSQIRFDNMGEGWSAWETPSSTKAWTLPAGDGTKYVWVEVKDNAGLISNNFYDAIILDTVAPTGSIVIGSGNPTYTTSTSATLYLSYADSGSGVYQVRYGNYLQPWSAWEAPAATKAWTLAAGDGSKSVWYQIMDYAGLISTQYSDSIILDTTAPTGSIIINGGAATTSTTSVTLALTYSDSGSGVNQVRYGSGGGLWSAWEAPSATKAWTLTSGAGLKTVYYQIMDNAGLNSTYHSDITLTGGTFDLKELTSWSWTSNTVINSVASGDVDNDGFKEIVTGGYFFDGSRTIAQLIVWNGSNMAVDRLTTWYWTGNTTINSVAIGDVDGDGQVEIVTGGSFFDGSRNVAQLIEWNGATLAVKRLTTWYWTSNTAINSVAIGDVDGDGQNEIATGGSYNDGVRNVAQLVIWSGPSLAAENIKTWYWTGNTVINSVALGDVDSDGVVEVVTGGCYNDGVRNIAQLVEWNGFNLAADRLTTWYWTGNTSINSVAIGDPDSDGQTEVVTGGYFNDGARSNAQLIEWNGSNLAVDRLTNWYWTSNTAVNSVAIGDVDGDGQNEIATGGSYNDGVRNIAQLILWSGSSLAAENIKTWYWTGNTTINSIALADVVGDSLKETIAGGSFYDGARANSQLTVWGMT